MTKEKDARKKGYHRLGWQFLILVAITVVIPSVLFFFIIVNRYSDDLLQQSVGERTALLQEINRTIALQLTDYEELSMTIYYNAATKDYIDSGEYDDPPQAVDQVLNSIRYSQPHVESVLLCFGDRVHAYGRQYYNFRAYREQYEEQVLAAGGRCVWLPTEQMIGAYSRMPKCFALARTLNSADGPVGTMYMFCSSNLFDKILTNPALTEGGSHYYILAPNGQIVGSDQIEFIGTDQDLGFSTDDCVGEEGYLEFVDDKGHMQIVSYANIKELGWTSVIVSDSHYVYAGVDELMELSGVFTILYFLALLLGYGLVLYLLIRPMSRLSKGMECVARGEFLKLPKPPLRNEVEQLTDSYNDMVVHIQRLIEQVRVEEEAKNRQRMKVLNMQIGPHFLHNTLNSVKWMAVLNNQVGIKNMVDALMKVVAGVTYNKEDNITVRQELELLDSYIYIQKVRFVNFGVQYDIPEEVMDLQIGRFMLQPFVENSILHGLRGLPYAGLIEIRATCSDSLYFEIHDNGKGFDPEQPPCEDVVRNRQDHIGIENVKERIRIHYGEQYGVRVESRVGGGTTVYLKLPIVRAEGGTK